MLRIASCSHSYDFCHLRTGRLSNVGVTSLQIHRSFASHTPSNKGETQQALADREIKVQKPHTHNQISGSRSHKEIDLEKLSEKILRKLKKRGITADSSGFIGPVPDGLDDLLGWSKIKAERLQRHMMPKKRKEIEELAAQGDGLSQLRLESILDYEKQFGLENIKNRVSTSQKSKLQPLFE